MKIQIGAIIFSLHDVDDLRDNDDSKIDATIKHNDCEIRIDSALHPQTRRQVIWHEILHSLMLQAGIREHDENIIEALSFGIFGVLQNNEFLRVAIEQK